MNVLVTGGAGFIGSNIVDALILKGHNVIAVDDLSTGQRKNINKKCKFYKMDIQDKKIENIFKKHRIDVVDHHAAQMDVRKSVDDPLFDARTNILGLLNLLENAVKYNVKKIIFASSGGVIYGEAEGFKAHDEEHTKHPISPYGVAKLTSEYYLQYYHEVKKLDIAILRYGNIYGPRQTGGEAGVIAIFIKNMLKNKECFIFGDGDQVRDYIYVADVVKANILALESKHKSFAVNIGTTKGTSVNQLYGLIASQIGYSKKPVYQPARPGELFYNVLKNSLAKKIIKWQPSYSLKKGLALTIEYFKTVV